MTTVNIEYYKNLKCLQKSLSVCNKFISWNRSMNLLDSTGWTKNARANEQKVNLCNTKKIYIYIWYKHWSSGTWFPSSSLLTIRENVQSVHLWVSMQALQKTRLLFFSSTTSKWECLPRFPMNCSSRTVPTCGSALRFSYD